MILQYESSDYEGLYASSKECLELFPTASTVYLLQGISANETGNHEDAVDALSLGMEMIVNDPPMKAEFYGQLGEAYFAQKDYTTAFSSYKKALDLDNRNASIKNNYARRLAVLKRDLDVAESLARQIVASYPQEALFIDTKGFVKFQQGKLKEAQDLFMRGLTVDATNPLILEHLGDAQSERGETSDAVESWNLAKEYGSKSETLDKKIANKKYYEPEL
jgi:Tfp pilus assembly protein PilF